MMQKQNILSLENKMQEILSSGIFMHSIKDDMAIGQKALIQRIHDYWQKNPSILYRRGRIPIQLYISRLAIKRQYEKYTNWISQMINKQIKGRERKKDERQKEKRKVSFCERQNFYRSGRQHTK